MTLTAIGKRSAVSASVCVLALFVLCAPANSEVTTVHGKIEVEGTRKAQHARPTIAVVWLTPLAAAGGGAGPGAATSPANLRLVQKNRSFEPRVLVAPAGAAVEFPNRDPFFHNVFSLFEGKRFDLGLYEAGTSRMVRFDRPGISYIFCNIHPEMSAVVITLDTPWYAVSTGNGQVTIADVPYGRYQLHTWSEGIGPDSKGSPVREITVAEGSSSMGTIRVPAENGAHLAHKNKYGRDYDPPAPDSSVYRQQH